MTKTAPVPALPGVVERFMLLDNGRQHGAAVRLSDDRLVLVETHERIHAGTRVHLMHGPLGWSVQALAVAA